MKSVFKYIIVFLIGVASTFFVWQYLGSNSFFERKKVESSTVLLEKVKRVTQLVTIQGELSEIYTHKDHVMFNADPFIKKALVRVKAKVLVGYDINDFFLGMDEGKKEFVVSDIGEAEILAIDHDLDYYDIQEGVFNLFSSEDYNDINAKAKKLVENKTAMSTLMEEANAQKEGLYEMLRFVVENAGWTLIIEPQKSPNLIEG